MFILVLCFSQCAFAFKYCFRYWVWSSWQVPGRICFRLQWILQRSECKYLTHNTHNDNKENILFRAYIVLYALHVCSGFKLHFHLYLSYYVLNWFPLWEKPWFCKYSLFLDIRVWRTCIRAEGFVWWRTTELKSLCLNEKENTSNTAQKGTVLCCGLLMVSSLFSVFQHICVLSDQAKEKYKVWYDTKVLEAWRRRTLWTLCSLWL